MNVNVITPEKTVFAGEAQRIQLPGASGKFEVLQDHAAALISSLAHGDVKITADGKVENLTITGGFVEVLNNEVTVLAEGIVKETAEK